MTKLRFGPHIWRKLLIYLGCAVLMFWVLAPIYWIVVSSISTRTELYAKPYKVWFPTQPTFDHYVSLFTSGAQYRSGGVLSTTGVMGQGGGEKAVISLLARIVVTVRANRVGFIFARVYCCGLEFT